MTDTPDSVSEPTRPPVANEPTPVEVTQAEPAQVHPKPRVSVVPLVLGGVVAAALGFGLAQVVPQGWPLGDVAQLSAQMTAQSEQVAALTTKLADLANAPVAKLDPALGDRLTAVEVALAAVPDAAVLMQRLDAVEKQVAARPVTQTGTTSPVDGAALAQIQAEIDALKTGGAALDSKLAAAASQLDGIKAAAQAIVTQGAGRSALHQLQAALDSGAPYGSALADLATTDLPAILTAHAAAGLPTIQTLRTAFPAAARAALDASLRATSSDSWTDRVSVFLRGQTGARSLTPREGTDPDAVLSRAEAAIATGELALALTELAGLPDAGKAAMAGWLDLAAQRQDAVAAVQSLSASLGQ